MKFSMNIWYHCFLFVFLSRFRNICTYEIRTVKHFSIVEHRKFWSLISFLQNNAIPCPWSCIYVLQFGISKVVSFVFWHGLCDKDDYKQINHVSQAFLNWTVHIPKQNYIKDLRLLLYSTINQEKENTFWNVNNNSKWLVNVYI